MKTETRSLWVKLTEKEKNQRGIQASEALRRRDDADAHAKLQAKILKGNVETIEAEMRKLAMAAREGSEVQDVECRWVADYGSGVMRLLRNDNDAEVEVRGMTKDERQTELPLHS